MEQPQTYSFPPLLKGEVAQCYVVCGKPTCRCRDGKRHGPYHYRIWRDGERTCKAYVKAEDLEATRAACEAYRRVKAILREQQRVREAVIRRIRQECRAASRLIGGAALGQPPTRRAVRRPASKRTDRRQSEPVPA